MYFTQTCIHIYQKVMRLYHSWPQGSDHKCIYPHLFISETPAASKISDSRIIRFSGGVFLCNYEKDLLLALIYAVCWVRRRRLHWVLDFIFFSGKCFLCEKTRNDSNTNIHCKSNNSNLLKESYCTLLRQIIHQNFFEIQKNVQQLQQEEYLLYSW